MNLIVDQYESRNGITPRNLVILPLSVSISNDILNSDTTLIQINDERIWVRSVTDHQFWAYQYSEHADMISTILLSFTTENEIWKKYQKQAVNYQKKIGFRFIMKNNQSRINNLFLEEFLEFKLNLLDSLLKNEGWKGWAPLSLYGS